jgi:hypothetical protein
MATCGRDATKLEEEMAVKVSEQMDVLDYIKYHLASDILAALGMEPDSPSCGCDDGGTCHYHRKLSVVRKCVNRALAYKD